MDVDKIKKWLAMHFWKFTLAAIVITLILHFLGVFNAAQAQTPWDERSIPMSFPAVEARDSLYLPQNKQADSVLLMLYPNAQKVQYYDLQDIGGNSTLDEVLGRGNQSSNFGEVNYWIGRDSIITQGLYRRQLSEFKGGNRNLSAADFGSLIYRKVNSNDTLFIPEALIGQPIANYIDIEKYDDGELVIKARPAVQLNHLGGHSIKLTVTPSGGRLRKIGPNDYIFIGTYE